MVIFSFLKALLFPPAFNLLLGLWGAKLLRQGKPNGKALVWFSLLSLWVLSLPGISRALIATLEDDYPAVTIQSIPHMYQAIVILGAGAYDSAPEYKVDTVDRLTLERLRYGAYLYHTAHLPIIVSGGAIQEKEPAVAQLMRDALAWDYGISDVMIDDQSRNTFENAKNVKKMLQDENIKKIILVTHAWHMPRAVLAFRKMGIEVLPAPMGFATDDAHNIVYDIIPRLSALEQSVFTLYEYTGYIWYKIAY
jgi:uncharacterized SAM-binding protein YcdF (DUF218 family)